jgi:hypothetical protein
MPVVNYPTSPKPKAVHTLGYGHQRWCRWRARDRFKVNKLSESPHVKNHENDTVQNKK